MSNKRVGLDLEFSWSFAQFRDFFRQRKHFFFSSTVIPHDSVIYNVGIFPEHERGTCVPWNNIQQSIFAESSKNQEELDMKYVVQGYYVE